MSTPISLTPGTLGYSCWPADPQTLNVDIITLAKAFLDQNFPGIYVGPTEPPADQRDRIWFNTISQKQYQYIGGAWQRTYDPPANSGRNDIIEVSVNDYNAEQGGDPTSVGVGDSSGPLWVEVTDFAGRVPIGIGVIPTSDLAASIVAIGDTKDSLGNGGEYQHVLTELEGAVGGHQHLYGISDPSASAAVFRKTGVNTVVGYGGRYIGGDPPEDFSETTADMQTLPSGLDGKGVVPSVGHSSMQPYLGRIFVKRTARVYVPAPY